MTEQEQFYQKREQAIEKLQSFLQVKKYLEGKGHLIKISFTFAGKGLNGERYASLDLNNLVYYREENIEEFQEIVNSHFEDMLFRFIERQVEENRNKSTDDSN